MTTFTGPLRVKGLDTDVVIGDVEVVQRVTVNAQNSAANPSQVVLPLGADMTSVLVDVEVPFQAGALATAAEVQVQLAGGDVINRIAVSASGRYDVLDDGAGGVISRVRDLAVATVQAFQSAQSLATAHTVGQAIITVKYLHN